MPATATDADALWALVNSLAVTSTSSREPPCTDGTHAAAAAAAAKIQRAWRRRTRPAAVVATPPGAGHGDDDSGGGGEQEGVLSAPPLPLTVHAWYAGTSTPQQAERILAQPHMGVGAFLVRSCAPDKGEWGEHALGVKVKVRCSGKTAVRHIAIRHEASRYWLATDEEPVDARNGTIASAAAAAAAASATTTAAEPQASGVITATPAASTPLPAPPAVMTKAADAEHAPAFGTIPVTCCACTCHVHALLPPWHAAIAVAQCHAMADVAPAPLSVGTVGSFPSCWIWPALIWPALRAFWRWCGLQQELVDHFVAHGHPGSTIHEESSANAPSNAKVCARRIPPSTGAGPGGAPTTATLFVAFRHSGRAGKMVARQARVDTVVAEIISTGNRTREHQESLEGLVHVDGKALGRVRCQGAVGQASDIHTCVCHSSGAWLKEARSQKSAVATSVAELLLLKAEYKRLTGNAYPEQPRPPKPPTEAACKESPSKTAGSDAKAPDQTLEKARAATKATPTTRPTTRPMTRRAPPHPRSRPEGAKGNAKDNDDVLAAFFRDLLSNKGGPPPSSTPLPASTPVPPTPPPNTPLAAPSAQNAGVGTPEARGTDLNDPGGANGRRGQTPRKPAADTATNKTKTAEKHEARRKLFAPQKPQKLSLINQAGPRGSTALIMLATLGDTDKVREIISRHGADVNLQGFIFKDDWTLDQKAKSFLKTTPLIAAVTGSHEATVRTLLELGAEPNKLAPTPTKTTSALGEAARLNAPAAIIRLLLQHGASPDVGVPLWGAAKHGNLGVALMLLDANADANACKESASRQTPLYVACSGNHAELAFQLIKRGADIEAKETSSGYTPLVVSCVNASKDCIHLLTVCGANVNATSGTGGHRSKSAAPLFHAVIRGDLATVEKLVERGADVNLGTTYQQKTSYQHNQTPLMAAIQRRNANIVEFLLGHNADCTQRQGDGVGVLRMAITAGDTAVFKALLKQPAIRESVIANGGDPTGSGRAGTELPTTTPLYVAAQHNRHEFAAALLDHGADINVGMRASSRQARDKTPLQAAAENGCTRVLQLLVARGADLGIASITGALLSLPGTYAATTSLAQREYEHNIATIEFCGKEDTAFNNFEYWKPHLDTDTDLEQWLAPSTPPSQGVCKGMGATHDPDVSIGVVSYVLEEITKHAGVSRFVTTSRHRKQCRTCGRRFQTNNALHRHIELEEHGVLKLSSALLRQIVHQNTYTLAANWDYQLSKAQIDLILLTCSLRYILAAAKRGAGADTDPGPGAVNTGEELLRISLVIGHLLRKGASPRAPIVGNPGSEMHALWHSAEGPDPSPLPAGEKKKKKKLAICPWQPCSVWPPLAKNDTAVVSLDDSAAHATTATQPIDPTASSGTAAGTCTLPGSLMDLARRTNTPGLADVLAGLCRRTHVGMVLREILYSTGSRRYLDIARYRTIMGAATARGGRAAEDILAVIRATGMVKAMITLQVSPSSGPARDQGVAFLASFLPGDLVRCSVCDEVHGETAPVNTINHSTAFQATCRHVACSGCTKQWIAACLERGDTSVLCPELGCTAVMLQADVARIAGDAAKARLKANQASDFRGKYLAELETVVDTEVESGFFGSDYVAGCAELQLHKTDATRRAALRVLQDYHEDKVQVCEICDDCYDDHPPTAPCIQVRR